MNETRGNARTKPMRENLKEREINSLKDAEKTNDMFYKYVDEEIENYKEKQDILYKMKKIWQRAKEFFLQ